MRILILLLLPSMALAGADITFHWDIPNLRVDGSELNIEDIIGYVIEEDGVVVLNVSGGTTTTAELKDRAYGSTYCYKIATQAEEIGPYSEELCMTIAPESNIFSVRPDSPLIVDFGEL